MAIRDDLLSWTRHFLQARNAILQDVKRMEDGIEGFDIVVETASKQQGYLILPNLEGTADRIEGLHGNVYVVTLNTKQNLDQAIEIWGKLAKLQNLCLLFVNPKAHGDQKWAVFPATHSALTDPKRLQAGLTALFSSVEEAK